MDIARYFRCLGPQDISLGNFQGTDRPTLTTRNWSVRFLSVARTRVRPVSKALPCESLHTIAHVTFFIPPIRKLYAVLSYVTGHTAGSEISEQVTLIPLPLTKLLHHHPFTAP